MEYERIANHLGENADLFSSDSLELVEDYFGDHARECKLLAQPSEPHPTIIILYQYSSKCYNSD